MLKVQPTRPSRTALSTLLVLIVVLLACGKIKEKIAEKAAEKAVERATGQKVDLEEGRVEIKDDKGNVAEWGAGTKIPEGWPDALAPYPGSKVLASYSARNANKLSGTLSMTTSDSMEKVLAHYTKSLSDFKLKSEMNMNGMQTKVFEKDGRTATINCIPKDKEVQANIVIANF